MSTLINSLKDKNGITVVEYALISGMITTAALGAMLVIGYKFLNILAG